MKRMTSDEKRVKALKSDYVLDTQAAAEYIGISASLLQQSRIKRGKKSRVTKMKSPNFVRLGRLVRYSIDDLDQWLSERRKHA